jgi:predicted lysophospholipase L1 biosynthesis ABC-type transport system permease subunit
MFLIEYALLGASTAAFGVGAGALAAYWVVTHIMQFDFIFDWRRARRRWRRALRSPSGSA